MTLRLDPRAWVILLECRHWYQVTTPPRDRSYPCRGHNCRHRDGNPRARKILAVIAHEGRSGPASLTPTEGGHGRAHTTGQDGGAAPARAVSSFDPDEQDR